MSIIARTYRFTKKTIMHEWYRFTESPFYIRHFHNRHIGRKVNILRKKSVIKVAFELHDITKWKTEQLYEAMLNHPRFEPVIVTCPSQYYAYSASCRCYLQLIQALTEKKIVFVESSVGKTIVEQVSPDIIIPQEPYGGILPDNCLYTQNRDALFCYANYAFHNLVLPNLINQIVLNLAWQCYYENPSSAEDAAKHMINKGGNIVCTGLPVQDTWLSGKSFNDPWKDQGNQKKRIIWAPHHTISAGENMFEQSTFLEIADAMLDLAKKYKNQIQWAFKPHPVLKHKLTEVWGLEKVEEYYSQWDTDFAQLETGEYYGLFMHSDALIHDCMSFTIEYQYTQKPAFYIENGKDNFSNCNEYSRIGHDLHYQGSSIKDIEDFIINVVINGNDSKSSARTEFIRNYLTPPGKHSACDNIINAILG